MVCEMLDSALAIGCVTTLSCAGIPLNDDDRTPWLLSLHHLIHKAFSSSSTCVLACSALKKTYRDMLEGNVQGFVRYIWLDIDPDLAKERCMLRGTESHFFPPSLIDSQYSILDMTTAESFCHVRIERGVKVEDIVTQVLDTIMNC